MNYEKNILMRKSILVILAIFLINQLSFSQEEITQVPVDTIKYLYTLGKDLCEPANVPDPKLRSFDIDSHRNKYVINSERFFEVESEISRNSRIYLETQADECNATFSAKYKMPNADKDFFPTIKLSLLNNNIVNKSGEKLGLKNKIIGGGTGYTDYKNNKKTANSINKMFQIEGHCDDFSDYSGTATFEFQIANDIEIHTVSKTNKGDTLKIGEWTLILRDIVDNKIYMDVLSSNEEQNLEFVNVTSDLQNELVEEIGSSIWGMSTLPTPLFNIFQSSPNLTLPEFRKLFKELDSNELENGTRTMVVTKPVAIETILIYFLKFSEKKTTEANYTLR